MPAGYTQRIESFYVDDEETLMNNIRDKIENMPEQTTPAQWAAEFRKIAEEQTCSARFYLMMCLEEQAEVSADTFTFYAQNRAWTFRRVSEDTAFHMLPEEQEKYVKLLSAIAAEKHGEAPQQWSPLVKKAMLRNKHPKILSKDEALKLAHGLNFNLKQVQGFLSRVLSNDSLNLTRADDLIEAFCFVHQPANDYRTAAALKEFYHAQADGIPKHDLEEKPANFTHTLQEGFEARVKAWEADAGRDTLDQFRQWLPEQAPNLDVPGRTAYHCYCRLAAFAYQLACDLNAESPDYDAWNAYTDMEDCIRTAYTQGADALPADAYTMAAGILQAAISMFDHEQMNFADRKSWRFLDMKDTGELYVQNIADRIPQLLYGTGAVTKADMLFMLWFLIGALSSVNEEETVYDRVCTFWNLAEEILEDAMLPAFYPPHILEQGFLISICQEPGRADAASPFEVYEELCEFYAAHRTRTRRQTEAEPASAAEDTGKARKALEKQAAEAYAGNEIDFGGLAEKILAHLLDCGSKHRKYVFGPEGICYDPDPELILTYPEERIAALFAAEGFDEVQRFRFLFGLKLYLREQADAHDIICDFRVSYRKNAILLINEFHRA